MGNLLTVEVMQERGEASVQTMEVMNQCLAMNSNQISLSMTELLDLKDDDGEALGKSFPGHLAN